MPAQDQTCLPSVVHDAEASDTSARTGCGSASRPVLGELLFPLLLAVGADAEQDDLSPSAEVRKILSPQTHGVEAPMPGQLELPDDVLVAAPLGGEALLGGVAVVLRARAIAASCRRGRAGVSSERGAKTAQEQ